MAQLRERVSRGTGHSRSLTVAAPDGVTDSKRGSTMSTEPPVCLWPDPHALGPVTDLYELTMIAGYFATGMADRSASFELFVRKMPPNRAYLVFAGLEQAIADLLRLAFAREQIPEIRRRQLFSRIAPALLYSLPPL